MVTARPSRMSRARLRNLLLTEGRAALLEEGLESGSSNLTFKHVYDLLEAHSGIRVTNASVIGRVWDSLADFQTDVLVSIAEDQGRPEVGPALDEVATLLAGIDPTSAESRARAIREVCRAGGAATTRALAESSNWSLWITVVSLSQSMPDRDQRERIRIALAHAHAQVHAFWSEQFVAISGFLGYRVRPDRTLAEFTVAVTALSEGCSIRQRISGRTEVVLRPTGPDDEDQEWTLFASGLDAIVQAYFEPDPGFDAGPAVP